MNFGYLINKLRTLFWSIFYKVLSPLFFSSLGSGCRFEGWVDIPQASGKIIIGDNVRLCRLVEFSVPKGGVLEIGNNASIGRGVLLSAHNSIVIGSYTMLAEYVCMHDNNHVFDDVGALIVDQGFKSTPLIIGSGCWLGAKSILLEGSSLGDGAVLGANSVLTRPVPANSVAVGSPAKVIRLRGA